MPTRVSIPILTVLLIALSGTAAADRVFTPEVLENGRVITTEEAKDLLGNAQFFDMRKPLNFGKGHVEGASPLPYDQKSAKAVEFDASVDRFDLSQLPTDKDQALVFYSDGPTGWKSYKAAVLAIRAGYTNVMWMRNGFAGWTAKRFPIE